MWKWIHAPRARIECFSQLPYVAVRLKFTPKKSPKKSQKKKRTEDSFESKSPPFHLTFSSALIDRQSAPRAFHSRFPHRNRTRCKILPHAFGPRTNNLRACHTLRFNRATKSYHQSIMWLRLKRSWILIYFRLLRTQGISQRFNNPETSKFGEPRDI